jgi:hypothetical protein
MGEHRAVCMESEAELELAPAPSVPRPPCRQCGSNRMKVYVSVSDSAAVTSSVHTEAASNNDSVARMGELRDAIARCRTAACERRISDAQAATKNALEALHGLEDGRRNRHEWAQSGWTSDELAEWTGLMGVRNAAHHLDTRVVVLVGGSDHVPSEADLQWTTLPLPINSSVQASAYAAREPQACGPWSVPQLASQARSKSDAPAASADPQARLAAPGARDQRPLPATRRGHPKPASRGRPHRH